MPYEVVFFNTTCFFDTKDDLDKAHALEQESYGDIGVFCDSLAAADIPWSDTAEGLPEARVRIAEIKEARQARAAALALRKPYP